MLKLGLIGVLFITLLTFIGGCIPSEGAEGGGFDWTIIIFLIVIFGIFYFIMVRPQRKRQKEHEQLVQTLNKGDRVVTAGGIYGVVESLSDDSIVLKVESGSTIRVVRGSVSMRRER